MNSSYVVPEGAVEAAVKAYYAARIESYRNEMYPMSCALKAALPHLLAANPAAEEKTEFSDSEREAFERGS